jgi:hypothetical protein
MLTVRLFLSGATLAGSLVAGGLWFYALVMHRLPLTGAGCVLAFQSISWTTVLIVAAIFGATKALSQFEWFDRLWSFCWWTDVFWKAFFR